MVIETEISWGYLELIKIFGKANELHWKLERNVVEKDDYPIPIREYIKIIYDDDSQTASSLTFLALRHLGVENMLCDYLMKCNVDPIMIPIGKYVMRKDADTMEKEWQEHRKKIGFSR